MTTFHNTGKYLWWVLWSLIILLSFSCKQDQEEFQPFPADKLVLEDFGEIPPSPAYLFKIDIDREISIGEYFDFLDSLVNAYDSLLPYPLNEHLLVQANSWIIDSLFETDYYRMMEKDLFVYDQKALVILQPGDQIFLPTLSNASEVMRRQTKTTIDINIPEFRLRIMEGNKLLYSFPVRVGQYRTRFLAAIDRNEDLRTKTGKGRITKHKKNPYFINPVNGQRFKVTRRDDNRVTLMPQIPWVGTEINGHNYGQMIHPTTNPKSLGKAYSNGCIGTRESDAWIIYYHAPVGTRLKIRYDLEGLDEQGDTVRWRDIYGRNK